MNEWLRVANQQVLKSFGNGRLHLIPGGGGQTHQTSRNAIRRLGNLYNISPQPEVSHMPSQGQFTTADRAEIAAKAIKDLQEMHAQFAQRLTSQSNVPREIGALSLQDGAVHAMCLGIAVRVAHRPVVHQDWVHAIEYAFRVKHNDEDIVVFRFFLRANGVLYLDIAEENRFCDFDNMYVAKFVLVALANALLKSPIFAAEV